MSDRQAALQAGMAAIWVKSLPMVRQQLDVLERVAMALHDNTITDELKREGQREAHRLTGAVGTFGFQQASADAAEIEQMLQPGGQPDARRMSELAVALRRNLDTDVLPRRPAAATPRILAVDDDAATLGVIRAFLRNAGFHVSTLSDPRGLRTALQDVRPDVILLDYEMPYVNGPELCKVIRSDPEWRTVPVIFVTSRNDPEAVTEVFTSGADDLVGKPIVAAELIARVRNRIEQARLLRQLGEE